MIRLSMKPDQVPPDPPASKGHALKGVFVFLALALTGLAVGTWADEADIVATWKPKERVEPLHQFDRDQWQDATRRAGGWIADFSSLDF